MYKNAGARRITAMIAIAAVVFVMLISVAYISEYEAHECTGADCPVCAMLEQCSNNLRTGGTLTIIFVAMSVKSFIFLKSIQYSSSVCLADSLITRKVRMNN